MESLAWRASLRGRRRGDERRAVGIRTAGRVHIGGDRRGNDRPGHERQPMERWRQRPWLSAHVELPVVIRLRVRLAAGATRWTPTNEPHESGEPAGRVSLRHVSVTVLRDYVEPTLGTPFGIYWGLGAGTYRYRIQHGAFRRSSRGLHALGGHGVREP